MVDDLRDWNISMAILYMQMAGKDLADLEKAWLGDTV